MLSFVPGQSFPQLMSFAHLRQRKGFDPMSAETFSIRAGAPAAVQAQLYGLLTDLIGNWVGNGFNLISKPGLDVDKSFVLQVNPTKEVLNFSQIARSVPDRGSVQPDLTIFGLTY